MSDSNQITKSVALTDSELKRKLAFDRASIEVQKQFTVEVIARKWNAFYLGAPAGNSTIERWLSSSPVSTKNPRFEPFICGLASISK